ncbi:VOC family protein [uncultured Gimesia sp.]|uniref:VOC family protein n=1 Tax=uncultured Gimesia sp. TaxID=1678688 RepID=UPI0030D8773D|tara:strand:- start:98658 stop:99110 length:453 start_codon:yes stop_codon:yes gene_type:complete
MGKSVPLNNKFCDSNQASTTMSIEPAFKSASPFQNDVLALPVTDLDVASNWYAKHFSMTEVERHQAPVPMVVLERDGTRLGFAVNGGDPSQDGAAILVKNIQQVKDELKSNGVSITNWRVDKRDGQNLQVFFVVAPDGLCYYFHEPIDPA